MVSRSRIYLDNAATSWPKPPSVYEAVDDFQRRLGAAAGRGGYAAAEKAGQAVEETRAAVARLIGAGSAEEVIFTFNGTDSLNLAIHGILKPGDHVITTVVEHNSVLRPLRRLEKRGIVEVTRVGCSSTGVIDPQEIRSGLRPETKLIIVTHASNVTGAIQPVSEIGAIAREHGVLFLVDAAQTLGHLSVSVTEIGADLLAAPGHKGLLGPLGTGILYIRRGVEQNVDCIRQGGTGSSSSSDEQPDSLPEKYESGNHNVPGIVGLGAGVKYIEERGLDDIRRHAGDLTGALIDGLSAIPGVRVYGPGRADAQIGVVSIAVEGHDPVAFSEALDVSHGIQVRAGYQCAGLMHRSLGTIETNGTIRFSMGPFNGEEDISTVIRAMVDLRRSAPVADGAEMCPCIRRDTAPATMTTSGQQVLHSSQREADIGAIPGLRELWQATIGDPDVTIAVLDGPVDFSHRCFEGANIVQMSTLIPAAADGGPASQHGTHVSSILFGQHDSPVKGIAPRCRGIVIPIFRDRDAESLEPCSQLDLARAISQAIEAGANIINISGGQFSPSGTAHPLLADVVQKCADQGILIVAAAGNEGCRCLHVPGALPSVLAVGAMDRNGDPLDFSNWGYGTEGILALGERIPGATPHQGIRVQDGTSFATALVSGVIGLLMSLRDSRGVGPSAHAVRSALLKTAHACAHQPTTNCDRFLAGRINIADAAKLFMKGEHYMPPSNQAQTESPLPSEIQPGPVNGATDSELLSAGQFSPTGTMPLSRGLPHDGSMPCAGGNGRAPWAGNVLPAGSPVRGNEHTVTPDQFEPRPPYERSQTVTPSNCGCSASQEGSQYVYALGRLSFDYGTALRRMSFANEFSQSNLSNIDDPNDLRQFLLSRSTAGYSILEGNQFPNRAKLTAITWTLSIDDTPVYAIAPSGPFAFEIHDSLIGFLIDQLDHGAERISVPGVITGQTRLYTGEVVPVISPDVRGMFSWTTTALVGATQYAAKATDASKEALAEFLNRVYSETRNLGISSQERAINYAATDALVLQGIFQNKESRFPGFEFDAFSVERSPICRPESDCWDVNLIFYCPENLQKARRVFRYTIDVSDVVPVTIGRRQDFSMR